MNDYLFRGELAQIDPALAELTALEAERQVRKLILIASESQAPLAVRELLASAFNNVYAEGYPPEETRRMTETEILDYERSLTEYRRYSDPRYYKGVEYVDVVEALARRRGAEAFAANGLTADDLFVNVQALSGAPANNAVYHALAEPGDTILGMNLLHGGHLSHGSSVNRSGKFYNAVHYNVDPDTQRINYDQIAELAQQHHPKFIIAGYSSYPWAVDWKRLKDIAKASGSLLFADIAHVAGLVAGGAYPSPVGYADVITFTTHKSLCGPRGACIITTTPALSSKIDRAVFPGEQGGPHISTLAAIALTFKLAHTPQFSELMHQVVKNCKVFSDRLAENGFRIAFGGTDTHLTNLDTTSVVGADGTTLSGDQAARILDIAGIVANRNTIPGDRNSMDPSGVRMGTVWVTQRGLREPEMVKLADLITNLLQSSHPYHVSVRKGSGRRAKVDFQVLEETKLQVRALAAAAGTDEVVAQPHGYPHFMYLDDAANGAAQRVFAISGPKVRSFMNFVFTSDVEALTPGQSQPTRLVTPSGAVDGVLTCVAPTDFRLTVAAKSAALAAAWLRDLSDGYVMFGDDPSRKPVGPIFVAESGDAPVEAASGTRVACSKPYFAGMEPCDCEGKPAFVWEEGEAPLRRTPLYELHQKLGAKLIPFAGWEMPVWYSSVVEEHLAVREAAGIFDVAHMGVYQVEGPDAAVFLDSVVGNDIVGLDVGESLYTHFLTPDADVIDDLLVYHRAADKFLVVVNASNDDKDWAWLNAVKDGTVKVDNERPCAVAYGRNAVLRNLRDPKEGADMLVDIALQGPKSREALLALGVDAADRQRIMALKRTQLCEATVGGFEMVVSRTGYTGEKMAFELFVHPEQATALFAKILEVGQALGVKPIGLGARDSLRTEAGLPLYGHEMGVGSQRIGSRDLGVAEGGFGTYVKTYKPWFIGRDAFLGREAERQGVVVRFRFNEKGVRMAHGGDPVLDKRGRVIGWVSSCAVDRDGALTGQAFVELKSAVEGTTILIYQGAGEKSGAAPAALRVGAKTVQPTPATVLTRFPK